ncbi:MAG TPA: hypothetical protein VN690_10055 [Terriglobales bacterium]|nr:hypothetical protein [Terriglobales bacterium]
MVRIQFVLAFLGLLASSALAQSPAGTVDWATALPPQQQQAQQQTRQGPNHIFFVIPSYNVAYQNQPPLSPHEKFMEVVHDTYDPIGLSAGALEVLVLEHNSKDGYCGYGKHWAGFGKCYASALADGNISGFVGDYLLPAWWHQDPRYFRLGQGSVSARVLYTLTRIFVTRSDRTGQPIFDSSQLSGTVIAGAASNLYYSKSDRGFGLTASRIGIDLLGTEIFNLEAEFWPDLKHLF